MRANDFRDNPFHKRKSLFCSFENREYIITAKYWILHCKIPGQQIVLFHKAVEPFRGTLGKWVAGVTKLCVKSNCMHKGFIILLLYGMDIQFTVKNNAPHAVCHHIPGKYHVLKCVESPNEQALLLVIGKECNVLLSAVVENYGKALPR